MRSPFTKLVLASLGAAVLLVGCGDKDAGDSPLAYSGPLNSCRKNGDCPSGAVCNRTLAVCVKTDDLSDETYLVRFKAIGRDPEVFEVIFDEAGEIVALKKPEAVTVETFKVETTELEDGGVLEEDSLVSLGGKMIVKDISGTIPGASTSVMLKQLFSAFVNLELGPGEERYAFEIDPGGDKTDLYPRQYLDGVTVEEQIPELDTDTDTDTESGQVIPFQVFPKTATLKGKIKRGSQPVDGLTVEAVDPETGRIVSTRNQTRCIDNTETNAVCGEFDLGLITEDADYYLRVSRPEESRYPTVTLTDLEAPVSSGRSVFTLDNLPAPVLYHATVRKPVVLSSNKSPMYDGIEGCTVIFESSEDGIAGGRVVITAVTDQTGALTELSNDSELGTTGVNIYPGTYSVTIIPPAAPPESPVDYTLLREVREIWSPAGSDIDIQGPDFILSFRTLLKFQVTAGGEAIPAASIKSFPLGHESSHARLGDSFLMRDGLLAIFLDPGEHLLTAEVPPQSGFAFAFREIVIPEDPLLLERPEEIRLRDLEALIPVAKTMQVISDDPGLELDGAELEWYRVFDVTGTALLVARANVRDNGNVTVLLPPPSAYSGK